MHFLFISLTLTLYKLQPYKSLWFSGYYRNSNIWHQPLKHKPVIFLAAHHVCEEIKYSYAWLHVRRSVLGHFHAHWSEVWAVRTVTWVTSVFFSSLARALDKNRFPPFSLLVAESNYTEVVRNGSMPGSCARTGPTASAVETGTLQLSQEVEPLLGIFGNGVSVGFPLQFLRDRSSQELHSHHSLVLYG